MKLYTRNGDDGDTHLFGGDRVSKNHPRVRAYGTVDELNAALGLAVSSCAFEDELSDLLHGLQSRLFDLGADLCCPRDSKHAEKVRRIEQHHIDELEAMIDTACADLPDLHCFILPGGTETAARLHVARTICRRAERLVVELTQTEDLGPAIAIFLNRLSDLLFALARQANHRIGVEDVPWKPE